MITFAKGVTSGYFPLGGVIISERLLEELRRSNHPDAMFGHGLTYTSHPDRLRGGAEEPRPAGRRRARTTPGRSRPISRRS